jgi:hypothetical protein
MLGGRPYAERIAFCFFMRRFQMLTTPLTDPHEGIQKLSLSVWDYEGGAGPCGPKESTTGLAPSEVPALTNTELVQLRIRVIALENIVMALLSDAPEHQHDRVRSMAAQISPRPGMTPHPLTTQAASQMIELVERAAHVRDVLSK